jgi:hypothetical protein
VAHKIVLLPLGLRADLVSMNKPHTEFCARRQQPRINVDRAGGPGSATAATLNRFIPSTDCCRRLKNLRIDDLGGGRSVDAWTPMSIGPR